MSEILTVFGATGNQGGSVIKAVLEHPELSKRYKIRGVTRDVNKPAAKELASAGVEPVKADLDDPSSLAAAVEGASAVFSVTNFWEKQSKDIEVAQGKAIADACAKAGVKHLVWSTIVHVTKISEGKYKNVLHFDGKAEVEDYIRGIKGLNASFFQPGPFMGVITGNMQNGQTEQGYRIALPLNATQKIPLFDPADSGKYVAGMLLAGEKVFGKRVAASTAFYTGKEMADIATRVASKPTEFTSITDEQFVGFLPEAVKKELGETIFFMRDYGYYGPPDPEEQVKAGHKVMIGEPTSLEEFVKKSNL